MGRLIVSNQADASPTCTRFKVYLGYANIHPPNQITDPTAAFAGGRLARVIEIRLLQPLKNRPNSRGCLFWLSLKGFSEKPLRLSLICPSMRINFSYMVF